MRDRFQLLRHVGSRTPSLEGVRYQATHLDRTGILGRDDSDCAKDQLTQIIALLKPHTSEKTKQTVNIQICRPGSTTDRSLSPYVCITSVLRTFGLNEVSLSPATLHFILCYQ